MNNQKKQAANDPVDGNTVALVMHVHVRVSTLWYSGQLPKLLTEHGMDALALYLGLPRQAISGIVAERKTS